MSLPVASREGLIGIMALGGKCGGGWNEAETSEVSCLGKKGFNVGREKGKGKKRTGIQLFNGGVAFQCVLGSRGGVP